MRTMGEQRANKERTSLWNIWEGRNLIRKFSCFFQESTLLASLKSFSLWNYWNVIKQKSAKEEGRKYPFEKERSNKDFITGQWDYSSICWEAIFMRFAKISFVHDKQFPMLNGKFTPHLLSIHESFKRTGEHHKGSQTLLFSCANRNLKFGKYFIDSFRTSRRREIMQKS